MTQITDVSKEPATMTVDDWLDSMSDKEQAQVLGVGKAQMYRDGKITLRDLLDQSGRPKPLYRLQAELDSSTVSPMIKMYRSPWRDDFPDVKIAHTETPITGHDKYEAAKSGSIKQALELVDEFVSDEFIIDLSKAIKGVDDLYILPVYAEEATGRNKIPLAYAQILQDVLDVGLETNIIQANKAYRTQSNGLGRLLK